MNDTAQINVTHKGVRMIRFYFQDISPDTPPVLIVRTLSDISKARENDDVSNPAIMIGQYTLIKKAHGAAKAEEVLGRALCAFMAGIPEFQVLESHCTENLHAIFIQEEPHMQVKMLKYAAFATEFDGPVHPSILADIARGILPPGATPADLQRAVSDARALVAA